MFPLITRPIKPIPLESFAIVALENLTKKSIKFEWIMTIILRYLVNADDVGGCRCLFDVCLFGWSERQGRPTNRCHFAVDIFGKNVIENLKII
jgi:hypothetical protein